MIKYTDRQSHCDVIRELKEPFCDIERIQKFFHGRELPERVRLDSCTEIIDVPKFVANHIEIVKHNSTKPLFYVYYERLQNLAKLL